MRIAILGGGGFRTPLAWGSVAQVAGVDEVVLEDVSEPRLRRIAKVIEQIRRESGGPPIRTTTSLVEAVEGAAVILCAIRVGGLEGRVVDETIPLQEGVLGQETVGPGGIFFALRTVPIMLRIAEVVRERAPGSWFLNFTNPAGLVTEALRAVLGDRVVGICDTPAGLFARVAAVLGRPRSELEFDYAGLNHLGWLIAVRDGERDLLPGLLADSRLPDHLEEARLFGHERLREMGMIPNEYLVYYEDPGAIVQASRRAGTTRAQKLLDEETRFYGGRDDAGIAWRKARDARFGTYMDEAWDAVGESRPVAPVDDGPGAAGYAAIASAFLRAISGSKDEVVTLNVANDGRLPFLDDDAVVEVPCTVSRSGIRPRPVGPLRHPQAELVARVKDVERTTIRAAIERSRALALQALAGHPIVPSLSVAQRILDEYLAASPELRTALT